MIELFVEELTGAAMQVLLFSLIPVVWWLMTARKKSDFFGWIGLKRIVHDGNFVLTILFTVLAALVFIFSMYICMHSISGEITTAGSQFSGAGIAGVPAVFVYAYIRTGLSEEIVFRGFILKRIKSKFGFSTGNFVQAMVFGLLHGIPFGLTTNKMLITVVLTILPGAFGYYMGWLNEKRCGESILSGWLIHGTLNFIVAVMAL